MEKCNLIPGRSLSHKTCSYLSHCVLQTLGLYSGFSALQTFHKFAPVFTLHLCPSCPSSLILSVILSSLNSLCKFSWFQTICSPKLPTNLRSQTLPKTAFRIWPPPWDTFLIKKPEVFGRRFQLSTNPSHKRLQLNKTLSSV